MGNKASITKSYMENPARFADLFNGYCFAGEARISPSEPFKSDLREVLKFIKYSKDKQRMMELVVSDPKFKSLDIDAAQTISICANVELKIPEGEEQINMCQAIEDMKTDARNEGLQEGIKEGRVDAQLTSIRNLMQNKGWTAQEAMDALMISAAEQEQYITMI